MAQIEIVRLSDAETTVHINPKSGVVLLEFCFTLKDGTKVYDEAWWVI